MFQPEVGEGPPGPALFKVTFSWPGPALKNLARPGPALKFLKWPVPGPAPNFGKNWPGMALNIQIRKSPAFNIMYFLQVIFDGRESNLNPS